MGGVSANTEVQNLKSRLVKLPPPPWLKYIFPLFNEPGPKPFIALTLLGLHQTGGGTHV